MKTDLPPPKPRVPTRGPDGAEVTASSGRGLTPAASGGEVTVRLRTQIARRSANRLTFEAKPWVGMATSAALLVMVPGVLSAVLLLDADARGRIGPWIILLLVWPLFGTFAWLGDTDNRRTWRTGVTVCRAGTLLGRRVTRRFGLAGRKLIRRSHRGRLWRPELVDAATGRRSMLPEQGRAAGLLAAFLARRLRRPPPAAREVGELIALPPAFAEHAGRGACYMAVASAVGTSYIAVPAVCYDRWDVLL